MGCLAGLLLLSACSSEENMADTGNKIDVAKGIRFQFTEEAFVPGEVAAAKQGTRALAEPQEIDLGNGIIAEATLEPDTAGCAQTRAGNPVPDGTYKIYAIDASGTRHDGLTGTMTGGVFTPNNKWELESGTYTFVCINSAVTDNGNELYIDMSRGRFKENNDNPLIGVVPSVVVTNPNDVIVNFVMRHQQARVRYGFVSYTEPIVNFDFDFDTDASWGGDIYYDLQGNKLRTGTERSRFMRKYHIPVHQDRAYAPSSLVTEYLHTTDYVYVSPEFTAHVFANVNTMSLYGRTITTLRQYYFSLGTLQKNHSYIWKLKYKNKDPWYLYNDGTIGSLAKRGSRTPIGIVVKEKTSASDKGLAAALNFTPNVIWEQDNPPAGSGNSYQNNTVCYPNPNAGLADMNGYNWTWDAASSLDGKVRGDEQTKYPAFYVAGHYNPGVTVTGANVGKWFLPSWGQLMEFFKLTAKDLTMPTGSNPSNPWFGANPTFSDGHALEKLNNYIIQAGGNSFHQSFISTSTQIDGTPTYRRYQPAGCTLNVGSGNDNIHVFAIWKTMSNGGVLPFVHF